MQYRNIFVELLGDELVEKFVDPLTTNLSRTQIKTLRKKLAYAIKDTEDFYEEVPSACWNRIRMQERFLNALAELYSEREGEY